MQNIANQHAISVLMECSSGKVQNIAFIKKGSIKKGPIQKGSIHEAPVRRYDTIFKIRTLPKENVLLDFGHSRKIISDTPEKNGHTRTKNTPDKYVPDS